MTPPTIEELRAIAARMDAIAEGASSSAQGAAEALARAVRDAAPTADATAATAVITVRVSPADKACLESIAAARHMSLSKHMIDRGLQESSTKPT